TNDKGEFRAFDLPPAEYYVRADVPVESATDVRQSLGPRSFPVGANFSDPNLSGVAAVFSPTYAPGSATPAGALSFKLRGGQEITAHISLLQTSSVRISGTVIGRVPGVTAPPIGFLLMPRNP